MTETETTNIETNVDQPAETNADMPDDGLEKFKEAIARHSLDDDDVQPVTQVADAPKVKPPHQDRASKRYIEIQRKERELRAREEKLQMLEAQQQRKAEQDGQHVQVSNQTYTAAELRRLAKTDVQKFLEQVGGIDYKYVNEYWMGGEKPPHEAQTDIIRMELDEKLEALRQEQRAFMQQQQQQREQEAISEWKMTANAFVSEPELKAALPLLFRTFPDDPVAAIQDVIVQDWNEQLSSGVRQPVAKSIDEAALALEEMLESNLKDLANDESIRNLLGLPSQRVVRNEGSSLQKNRKNDDMSRNEGRQKGRSIMASDMQRVADKSEDELDAELYSKVKAALLKNRE
jgi:hypothetical protein